MVSSGSSIRFTGSFFETDRRRGRKLLRFAETEADGGRDLARAAEVTSDALLRRLYLRHAADEQRHAELFRRRGQRILSALPAPTGARRFEANWLAPGERGLDDLRVERESDDSLLAFLHLSEKAAAGRFAVYRERARRRSRHAARCSRRSCATRRST